MFLISNFDFSLISNLFGFAQDFFTAVGNAFNSIVNAIHVFFGIWSSFLNRMSSSGTLMYSFYIIIATFLVVFVVFKIWRD